MNSRRVRRPLEIVKELLGHGAIDEELIIFLDEFKREVAEEIGKQVRAAIPPEVRPVEVTLPKIEIPSEPMPRPFHSYGSDNLHVDKATELFNVKGEGLLETFFVVCTSNKFRLKLVVDGKSPVSYDNRTFAEYQLLSSDDNHVSADYDEIEGETVYKVAIDDIPFWKGCAGYVSPVGEPILIRLWRASLSFIPR